MITNNLHKIRVRSLSRKIFLEEESISQFKFLLNNEERCFVEKENRINKKKYKINPHNEE